MRSGRVLLTSSIALLFLSAGCVSLDPAAVPARFLEGGSNNGWRVVEDTGVEGGAFSKHALVEYGDEAEEGEGYPGHLSVLSVRGLLSPDRDDLRDRAGDALEDGARDLGYRIDGARKEGERTLANGARSLYIVLTTEATAEGAIFTEDATVKAIAEVFRCTGGATVIVSGSAQIDEVRSIGGIPTTIDRDPETWSEIVEDPSGTIENHRGSPGLIYNVQCG